MEPSELRELIEALRNSDTSNTSLLAKSAATRKLFDTLTRVQEWRLCETCGDGRGYLWPWGFDGRADHDYVERCDACDRFADDRETAAWLVRRLRDYGFSFHYGSEMIDVGVGARPRPFIDNVREEVLA